MVDHPVVLILGAIVSYPVYRELGKMFFGDPQGVVDDLRYVVVPNWWWLLRGKFREDWDATLRVFLFAVLCAGWIGFVYNVAIRLFFRGPA